MRLSRIFVDQALDEGAQIRLEADSNHYVKNVLRLKHGATILLFNGKDLYDYKSQLCYEGKKALARIQGRVVGNSESVLSTEIIQGLSRSDHMDWMVQKCTELGVTRISIFNAQHTQILLKSAQLKKRLLHWKNIAIKACEQCGRHYPPQLNFQQSLGEILNSGISADLKILLDFKGERLRSERITKNATDQVAILLGPEGGLSDSEIKAALNVDFIATRLGPRVLRTETAAATALAIVQYNFGDL
jgi:16S rRNA (uracil1498-N3)-methyltransferase